MRGPVHEPLIPYVVLAAVAGTLLPGVATSLAGLVPVFLAGQVGGVAATLTAGELLAAARTPRPLIVSLALMWAVVPLIGIGLGHMSADHSVAAGIVITAAVPSEITSPLVALLAGGGGGVAITTMVASLAAGTVLTPVWVGVGLGGDTHIDRGALITELGLSVTLPLIVAVAIRTRLSVVARYRTASLDVAAVSVILVVFVAAGYARDLSGWSAAAGAAGLALALQAGAYAVGWATFRLLRSPGEVVRAVLFPIGMREFGIATAVALVAVPSAAGVAGLYGVLLMVSAPALALLIRPR